MGAIKATQLSHVKAANLVELILNLKPEQGTVNPQCNN